MPRAEDFRSALFESSARALCVGSMSAVSFYGQVTALVRRQFLQAHQWEARVGCGRGFVERRDIMFCRGCVGFFQDRARTSGRSEETLATALDGDLPQVVLISSYLFSCCSRTNLAYSTINKSVTRYNFTRWLVALSTLSISTEKRDVQSPRAQRN